jgi:O-antigen/teichoic acid export membrane protein
MSTREMHLPADGRPPEATGMVEPSALRSSISVFVWIGLSSVLLYAFGAVLARQLGPDQYGLFASVFGIVGLAGLALGGLQTAVATAVAGLDRADRLASISVGVRPVALLGCGVALLFAVASPVLQNFLRADSLLLPLAAALIVGILVPWSAVLGVYQGAGSFSVFGRLTFLQALLRLGALAALLVTRDVAVILFGVALWPSHRR